jgi:CheY-like chemotaxis protein
VKEERRILIVDDDRDSTRLLKLLLEKTGGYVVLEENDAAKALQSAHNFRPHLILLDIMMPQRDGVELASEIDADPQLQRTPIIFLTALGDARAGLRIQGYPVLAKPIKVPELINRLEENLATSRSDMVANRKGRNRLWGTTGFEAYEIRPHENGDGVDLISDQFPLSPIWYAGPDAVRNAVAYAKYHSLSRSHQAKILVLDDFGAVIQTH